MDPKQLTIKLLVLSFVVVYVFTWEAVDGEEIRCIEKERKALLRFKKDIVDEYNVLSSWGSEEAKWECCKWNGILCSNRTGHVISLKLVGLDYLGLDDHYGYRPLRGNISSSLLELHHLTRLDLSDNNFSGKEIPEFIGSLKQLKHLNLRSCGFGGIVPHQLGNLTNLRTLDLGYNYGLKIDNLNWLSLHSSLFLLDLSYLNFTQSFETVALQYILKLPSLRELHLSNSEFPSVTSSFDAFVNSTSPVSILDLSFIGLTSLAFRWLFNTTKNIVRLDLSGNKLDGSIPDAFGKQIFLEDLDLSFNRLEGGIPKSMWNLSRLHTLVASDNLLKEPLSNSFHNLSGEAQVSLQILDLSYNQITGSFPDLIAFSVLRTLNLDNNKLKDDIPSTVWQLSKLENLDVSYNSLEGTILEANLSKLYSLKVLDLSFNSLAINLTHDWVPPFQLDVLSLARCSIGPRFPAWLQTQSSFSLLDLSFNNISDELPKWFWDFSFRLYDLDLSHNQIRGKLPNLFSKYIRTINLSFNNFSGLLSKFHPNTQSLQLSYNMFEGSLSSLCTTANVSLLVLELSNNQLSGALPNCWENMTRLTVLNLANNNFSGEIPHNLGSLKDLLRLHLRNNSLSGVLPSSLKKCQSLAMIDVGGNKLTGNIPAWIGSHLTGLNILSIRGNRFDGSIPPELCRLTGIQILDLSRNNISGRIPSQCFNNSTFLPQNIRNGLKGFGFSFHRFHDVIIYTIDDALVQWKQQEFE